MRRERGEERNRCIVYVRVAGRRLVTYQEDKDAYWFRLFSFVRFDSIRRRKALTSTVESPLLSPIVRTNAHTHTFSFFLLPFSLGHKTATWNYIPLFFFFRRNTFEIVLKRSLNMASRSSSVNRSRNASSTTTNSAINLSRAQEKEQLETLNDRLAVYIDTVRRLEQDNRELKVRRNECLSFDLTSWFYCD